MNLCETKGGLNGKELKKQKLDMLNGSIWNKLPVFALPIAATGILEQLLMRPI